MFVVFLCVFESVAFEVHIDDDGVMYEPVDHRGGGHRVLEDGLPSGEGQV